MCQSQSRKVRGFIFNGTIKTATLNQREQENTYTSGKHKRQTRVHARLLQAAPRPDRLRPQNPAVLLHFWGDSRGAAAEKQAGNTHRYQRRVHQHLYLQLFRIRRLVTREIAVKLRNVPEDARRSGDQQSGIPLFLSSSCGASVGWSIYACACSAILLRLEDHNERSATLINPAA